MWQYLMSILESLLQLISAQIIYKTHLCIRYGKDYYFATELALINLY